MPSPPLGSLAAAVAALSVGCLDSMPLADRAAVLDLAVEQATREHVARSLRDLPVDWPTVLREHEAAIAKRARTAVLAAERAATHDPAPAPVPVDPALAAVIAASLTIEGTIAYMRSRS